MPQRIAETDDFWTYGRRGSLDPLRSWVYVGILVFSFYGANTQILPALGFATPEFRVVGFWFLPLFQLITVAIHEFGHAAVALSLGFRFRSLNIGPFTFQKDAGGHRRFHFDFSRILTAAGYAGSVPDSGWHVRSRSILVFAAGPLASLLGALLMASLCLNLKGTAAEPYMHTITFMGALFLADFVTNLLPIGYSDGTMLFHTILWTEKGQNLYSKILGSTVHDDADRKRHEFNRVEELALRRTALEQAEARGNQAELAQAYHALATAEFQLSRLPEAEQHYRSCLQCLEFCRNVNPGFEAHCWYGLHQVLRIRHQAAPAQSAYDHAVLGFERAKASCKTKLQLASTHLLLAVLHREHQHTELALREIEQGLALLPEGPQDFLTRVEFFFTRMSCEFDLGFPERGLASAGLAESLLRSPEVPEADRNRAAQRLGALGIRLEEVGRGARGASLLLESAQLCGARGMQRHGISFRLMATATLRRIDRLAEAEAAFPSHAEPDADGMRNFLSERAELHRAAGRIAEALADFEEATRLAQQDVDTDQLRLAQHQVWLALGYFETGRLAEAEATARAACDVLSSTGHPDAGDALVTLALLAWRDSESSARAYLDRAATLVRDAPFLEPSDKAHFFKRTSARLEAAGRTAEAEEARAAAERLWRFLGVESPWSSTAQELLAPH
ncbi:MAG TPA: M50 family metallopeptidase [Bryobacteraceae bacterium]|jgi:tetratricopeptide (TPR) repeat protein